MVRALLASAATAGLLVAGWTAHEEAGRRSRWRAEVARQQPEIAECRRRLALFHTAWSTHRRRHRGADPPSIAALVPTYVPTGRLFFCPTAERSLLEGRPLDAADLRIGRRTYRETYGFLWLSAGSARRGARSDGSAPLVVCTCHREALYWRVERRKPGLGAFDSPPRRGPAYPGPLAVRRDGRIGELAPGE